ncbi:MAG TPA: hypothetical protein VH442_15865, partial [Micromonosporaceae bacterium]
MSGALDERAAQDDAMRPVPRELRLLPFRGSLAVASKVLTWGQLRGPTWRRLLPDVYVAADVEIDHRVRCAAAILFACRASVAGRIAVSGLSAAACWGVDLLQSGAPVELTVPPAVRIRSRPGELRVVRSHLSPSDVAAFGSLVLTSPERTTLDVIRRSGRADGVVLLDAMLRRRIVTVPGLRDASATWLGRRGGLRIMEALRLAEPLSESPMETRSRLVLVDGGLPRPVAQYVVRDSDGRFVARLDLAYPLHRVGLEYEGDHHRERVTFRRDIARLNRLTEMDWLVVRITADDIYRNPARLARRVAEI